MDKASDGYHMMRKGHESVVVSDVAQLRRIYRKHFAAGGVPQVQVGRGAARQR